MIAWHIVSFIVDNMSHQTLTRLLLGRLLFLDNTLRGIIERFETEYPETRLSGSQQIRNNEEILSRAVGPAVSGRRHSHNQQVSHVASTSMVSDSMTVNGGSDSESDHGDHGENNVYQHGKMAKRNSEVSLAARAQSIEEGKVLRIGQQLNHHDDADEDEHIRILREKLDALNTRKTHEQNEERGTSAVQ